MLTVAQEMRVTKGFLKYNHCNLCDNQSPATSLRIQYMYTWRSSICTCSSVCTKSSECNVVSLPDQTLLSHNDPSVSSFWLSIFWQAGDWGAHQQRTRAAPTRMSPCQVMERLTQSSTDYIYVIKYDHSIEQSNFRTHHFRLTQGSSVWLCVQRTSTRLTSG